MDYCFVLQDLQGLSSGDPWMLQANYAMALGQFLCCDIRSGAVTDSHGTPLCAEGKAVLLRATCDHMTAAMECLQRQGAVLFEPPEAAERLLWWDSTGIARRQILSLSREALLLGCLPDAVAALARQEERLFLKSRKKGFSAVVASGRLLRPDEALSAFLQERAIYEALMVSPVYEIGSDSLGTKESRHIVLDSRIVSSSRPLHSVRHRVSRKHLQKAEELVAQLGAMPDFPRSYVLDVGEFSRGEETFVDVVELNPLTSSMCYVNNTIFTRLLPEAADFRDKSGMGYEYCLHARSCPDAYVMDRLSGADYGYHSPEVYRFL